MSTPLYTSNQPGTMDYHYNLSPLDSRYRALNPGFYDSIAQYLSEAGSIKYFGIVEAALASTLAEVKIAPSDFGDKVVDIIHDLDFPEIYAEEKRIQHNIRALVNYIQKRLPAGYKQFVHLFATSSDVLDSARALQEVDPILRTVWRRS